MLNVKIWNFLNILTHWFSDYQEKNSLADEESHSEGEDEDDDDDVRKSQKLIGSLPRLKIWYENLVRIVSRWISFWRQIDF